MFEDAQKQSELKKIDNPQDASVVSDFIIHVMPESFKQKKTVVKEDKKPVIQKPIIASAPVVTKPALVSKTGQKASKTPWILGVVGLFFVIVLGAVGFYAVYSYRNQEPVQDVITEVPQVEEPVIQQEEIMPGRDLDSDGLTDIEEIMYGTNPRDPDTDRDTYLDGNEVFHRYSPLGVSPQTLLDTGAVKEYLSGDSSFVLTYPSQWTVAGTVDSEFEPVDEIVFRTNSNAAIRLTSSEFSEASFDDWYVKNAKDGLLVQLETTLTKGGYVAYQSPDDLIAYVVAGDVVYTFFYDLADEKEIVYMQTFQMMINSFSILP
jgi:hypothetical protein